MMNNIKVKTTRPGIQPQILSNTSSGIHPTATGNYTRRSGVIPLDTVQCDVCNKKGIRAYGKVAPDGWLYGESFIDDKADVMIIYACSMDCCAMFWRPGPGDLYAGKMPEQIRRIAVSKKAVAKVVKPDHEEEPV